MVLYKGVDEMIRKTGTFKKGYWVFVWNGRGYGFRRYGFEISLYRFSFEIDFDIEDRRDNEKNITERI